MPQRHLHPHHQRAALALKPSHVELMCTKEMHKGVIDDNGTCIKVCLINLLTPFGSYDDYDDVSMVFS